MDANSPAPTRTTLVPVAQAPSAPGRVVRYDAGPAGLAVQMTADLDASDAARLDGDRVWVTADGGGAALLAFQAVVNRVDQTTVEVTGISVPVEERRRRQLRAATRVPARLGFAAPDQPAPTVVAGHTLDLSRGGCRLDLGASTAPDELPTVGTTAEVSLEVDEQRVAAAGEVLRVDPATGEVAVRFAGLDPAGADRVERHVLRLVVSRR